MICVWYTQASGRAVCKGNVAVAALTLEQFTARASLTTYGQSMTSSVTSVEDQWRHAPVSATVNITDTPTRGSLESGQTAKPLGLVNSGSNQVKLFDLSDPVLNPPEKT